MDRQFGAVLPDDAQDLEESARDCGAQIKPRVVVLVLDHHRIGHGMTDVLVGDAVSSGRVVDFHSSIVLRNPQVEGREDGAANPSQYGTSERPPFLEKLSLRASFSKIGPAIGAADPHSNA